MPVQNILARLNRGLEKVIELILLFLLAFFLVLILYQVVSRNIPILPPIYWTEEFARFAFQWTVMLGTALGVYHSDHFVLEAFPRDSTMDRITRYLREFILLAIAIFFVTKGWEFAETGWRRKSTAAHLPMFWLYVTFFSCGVIMIIFKLQRLYLMFRYSLDTMEQQLNTFLPDAADSPSPTAVEGRVKEC